MRLSDLHVRTPADFSPISEEIFETTLVPQFEKTVERQPDHTAIQRGSVSLSYGHLNNAINHLAHQILRVGGSDRSPIAILMGDEVLCIAAAFAAVKSGRPYVMLYPGQADEVGIFLRHSQAGLLLASRDQTETLERIPAEWRPSHALYVDGLETAQDSPNPGVKLDANGPFAIYYTSGSTGAPKGVLEGHLSKSYRAFANINLLRISPSDRVALVLSVWHTGALSNLISTLVSGATLLPLSLRAGTTEAAASWMARERVSAIWCMPSILRSMFQNAPADLALPHLRFMRLGGETISTEDVKLFKRHTAPDCLLNLIFATTEAGAVSEYPVYHDTPPFQGVVPAGFPIPGVEVTIQDEDGSVLGDGAVGEICASSPFVSLGYWNNPELTRRVFTPHPRDPNVRVCHTGDLGRWREDGLLEILGRMDTQVKIRGFRVQLEAVDLALRSLDGVQDAAAVADRSGGRGPRLVAYVAVRAGHPFSVSRLREQLASRLPNYAVPSMFIRLDALPRSTAGKLARAELPEASGRRPELSQAYVAPRNELEAQIAAIWERQLGLRGVGVDDNYFELGGDSLSFLDMTLELEKALALSVPQTFFRQPTIRGMLAPMQAATASEPLSRYPGLKRAVAQDAAQTPQAPRAPRYARHLGKLARQQGSPLRKLKKIGRYVVENRFVDILVARVLNSMPFLEARDRAMRWGQNRAVQSLLFPRRRRLYARFLEHTGSPAAPSAEGFGRSIAASMLFSIAHWWEMPLDIQGYRASRRPYYRTLAHLLDEIPVGSADGEFPVIGAENLWVPAGKGVILVSIHGAPLICGTYRLERLLGCDPIPTISDFAPYPLGVPDEGQLTDSPENSAMLAEIALFAQSRLQAGGLVNMLPDVATSRGSTGCYSVLGKQYWFKSGFAELALNTGAVVVPYYHAVGPDGRIQTRVEAAFHETDGPRETKVHGLLSQYARFMEHAFRSNPSTWFWVKMEIQLGLPSVDDLGRD